MNRNITLAITLFQSEFLYLITQCPAVVVFGTVQLITATPHIKEVAGKKHRLWVVQIQAEELEAIINLLVEIKNLQKSQGK
jgi:hypothetical protein